MFPNICTLVPFGREVIILAFLEGEVLKFNLEFLLFKDTVPYFLLSTIGFVEDGVLEIRVTYLLLT